MPTEAEFTHLELLLTAVWFSTKKLMTKMKRIFKGQEGVDWAMKSLI